MKRKKSGRAVSMPAGILLAACLQIMLTILGSILIAAMLNRGILPIGKSGYAVMALLSATAAASGIMAAIKIKRRKLYVCLLCGGIYWGLLLGATALFFGGQYAGIGESGITILMGSILSAVLTCFLPARKRKY